MEGGGEEGEEGRWIRGREEGRRKRMESGKGEEKGGRVGREKEKRRR